MSAGTLRTAKLDDLRAHMLRLNVREEDVVETFILGSGAGGQKINKTNSCVRLRHLPSGLIIRCQSTRSRELNRFLARRKLCDRLEAKNASESSLKSQEAERIRRQKKRRTRRQKERILKDKRLRSAVKALRASPAIEHE